MTTPGTAVSARVRNGVHIPWSQCSFKTPTENEHPNTYYGMKATGYLFGDSAAGTGDRVLDAMIFMMSIANVIDLYILAKTLRNEVKGHHSRVSTGEFARVK